MVDPLRPEFWPIDDDEDSISKDELARRLSPRPYGGEIDPDVGLPDSESEEDVLSVYGHEGPPQREGEPYKSAILIEEIADEVASTLKLYRWHGGDTLDGKRFLELCDSLGVAPEPLRAMVAIEDIGFAVETRNYEARTLEEVPTVEDIAMEGIEIEDVGEYQEEKTIAAYNLLRKYVSDPIVDRHMLRVKKASLLEEIRIKRTESPKTMQEYDEQQEHIGELERLLDMVIKRLDILGQVEEVTERRERAFRRMRWLMTQDIFVPGFKTFFAAYRADRERMLEERKAELEAEGKESSIEVDDSFFKLDFEALVRLVAGSYEETLETEESNEAQMAEGGEARPPRMVLKYHPGMVDRLLDKHRENMVDEDDKLPAQVKRDQVLLRRLEQAKAICERVFQNDISDRVYGGGTVSAKEYEALSSIRERLYVHGDTQVLDDLLSFLPGSHLRSIEDAQIDNVPLTKLSGKSKLDLIKDIDTIINEHPDMDIEGITELMQAKNSGHISRADDIELSLSALKILEKLGFKKDYSIRKLLSKA